MSQNIGHEPSDDASSSSTVCDGLTRVAVAISLFAMWGWALNTTEEIAERDWVSARVDVIDGLREDVRWAQRSQRAALCDAYLRSALELQRRTELPMYPWLPPPERFTAVRPLALLPRAGHPAAAVVGSLLDDARWSMPDQRGPLCHALFSSQDAAAPGPVG